MFTRIKRRGKPDKTSQAQNRFQGLLKSRSTPSFRTRSKCTTVDFSPTSTRDGSKERFEHPPSSAVTFNTTIFGSRTKFAIRKKINGLVRRDSSVSRDDETSEESQTNEKFTDTIKHTFDVHHNHGQLSCRNDWSDTPLANESIKGADENIVMMQEVTDSKSILSFTSSDLSERTINPSSIVPNTFSPNDIYTAIFRIHQKPFFEILRRKSLEKNSDSKLKRPQHILRTGLDFHETLEKFESNEYVEKENQAEFFKYFKLRLVEMRDHDMPLSRCTEF